MRPYVSKTRQRARPYRPPFGSDVRGANRVFNHTEAGYLDLIREASDAGPDVIIEMLANDLNVIARMAGL